MKTTEYLAHTFLTDFIDENSIVIDLGGNKGEFTKFIVEKFGSNVYIVEPVPELYNQIPNISKIKKFNYCIASKNETIELSIPKNQCPTIYKKNFDKKIICQGITLEKFLIENEIKEGDLLKVDIEGAEIEMFESLSENILANFKQIAVEFHDFLWPELKEKVENIKRKIADSGFYCIKFSIKNNGDVLFVRKDLISRYEYILYKYFWRYFLGVMRVLKRILKISR